jgi:hypothetical protein
MGQTIAEKELNNYFTELTKQLKMTHSSEETQSIITMLKQGINEYLEINPTATMADLREQFGNIDDMTDVIISQEDSNELAKKIQISRMVKKFLIAVLFLLFIVFSIETTLYIKSYNDAQKAMIDHEVIIIE